MFDHLEPKPVSRVLPHHRYSLSIMMGACLSLMAAFIIPLVSFTQTITSTDPVQTPEVKIWLDAGDTKARQIVGPIDNLNLAHYVLDTNVPVTLDQITVMLDGLYQPTDLTGIRLYVDEFQIGREQKVNAAGQVIFEEKTAVLPAGSHDIILRTNWQVSRPDQLMIAKLDSAGSIWVSYQNKPLVVGGVFPLSTAGLTSVNHGSWQVIQPETKSVSADGDHNFQFVDFDLPIYAKAEAIDLGQVKFYLQTQNFKMDNVRLLNGDTLWQSWSGLSNDRDYFGWQASSTKISVPLDKNINLKVRVTGMAQREGAGITLTLNELIGTGFISNQPIIWPVKNDTLANSSYQQVWYLVHDQPLFSLAHPSSTDSYAVKLNTLSGKDIIMDNIYLELTSEYSYATSTWKVKINDEEQARSVKREASGQMKFRFPQRLTIHPKDIIQFYTLNAPRPEAFSGVIRLLAERLEWYATFDGWFAVKEPLVPLAPASPIRF